MGQPHRWASHRHRFSTILVAALSPVAVLLPATLIGADSAVAAASPGYIASFIPAGDGPQLSAAAVDPATDTVYVGQPATATNSAKLIVIDGSSRTVKATIPLGSAPPFGVAVNPVTDTVYVPDRDASGSHVDVIDGSTNTVTATIPLPTGSNPAGIAVDSATNMIYVAANTVTAPGVVVVDGSTNTVATTLSSGGRPLDIAVDEATDVIWVTNSSVASVAAISGTTGSIIHSVALTGVARVAVNPVTNTVYAAQLSALTVIDGASGKVTTTVPISKSNSGQLAVDSSADVIFARDAPSINELAVIDGATNTVADTFDGADGAGSTFDPATGTLYETSSIAGFPGLWAITPSAANRMSPLLKFLTGSGVGTIGDPMLADFWSPAGLPPPRVTETGKLPAGVTLTPQGVLSGTPVAGTAGVYPITVTASNGIAPNYSIPFTVTIHPRAPLVAVAAEGTDGVPYSQAPQLSGGNTWVSLGGHVAAVPAVAAPPNAGGDAVAPLFIAPGTNHLLYIRAVTGAWVRLGPNDTSCLSVAAAITGNVLQLACETLTHGLSYNTAVVPASGLPVFASKWKSLGGTGTLSAGPAVARVNGALTFFVTATDGRIHTTTTSGAFTTTGWACQGQPAAAVQASTGTTFFACQGPDNGLWETSNGGTGWGPLTKQSGTLAAGPGVAPTTAAVVLLLEGTNHSVYRGSPGSTYVRLGTLTVTGVQAAALN